MREWIGNNYGVLTVAANFLMLLVWVLYFQLLLHTYRHQLRAKILINRAGGKSFSSHCVITNMSAEKIYLESVLLTLIDDENESTYVLTELADLSTEVLTTESGLQGPLASGELVDIGPFRTLITHAVEKADGATNTKRKLRRLIVAVVATYTAEDRLIGAERAFDVDGECLIPLRYAAEQIRSGRRRRQIERFMLDHVRNAG